MKTDTYTVYIADNFNGERFSPYEYSTAEEALNVCKRNVDSYLEEDYKPGMTGEDLLTRYKRFGEDPWVQSEGVHFSAWQYAEKRCKEICGEE